MVRVIKFKKMQPTAELLPAVIKPAVWPHD